MDRLILRNIWKLSNIFDRHIFSKSKCSSSICTVNGCKSKTSNLTVSSTISAMESNNKSLHVVILRNFAKGRGGKIPASKKGAVRLSDEELLDVVDVFAYRLKLQSVLDKMKADFVTQLSIRTSVGAVESLQIYIDGQTYSLNELAQISRKNPNLIALNMVTFPDGLKPVMEAITQSGLGLNPQQEGTMIYLPVPKVTREFRETLSKQAKVMFTKTKDNIKDIQNLFTKEVKTKTQLPKDLVFNAQQTIMAIAGDFATEAEKILNVKQKDLLGNDS